MMGRLTRRPLISAGTMLGIGMGGFIDGIVFHQLLQVHNMLSAKFPTRDLDAERLVVNLELNMFWDGLFHLATWIATAMGIAMLWHASGNDRVPHSTQTLFGSLLLGWGLFNVVEGLINHHLLHIHHVLETPSHLTWGLLFLAFGIILIVLGSCLIWTARPMPNEFS